MGHGLSLRGGNGRQRTEFGESGERGPTNCLARQGRKAGKVRRLHQARNGEKSRSELNLLLILVPTYEGGGVIET